MKLPSFFRAFSEQFTLPVNSELLLLFDYRLFYLNTQPVCKLGRPASYPVKLILQFSTGGSKKLVSDFSRLSGLNT